MINGITRELLLRKWLSKMPAHFLSTAALIGVMTPYFWQLDKRWPLPTTRRAAEVGAAWLNLTVLFEFGLGRFEGQSWSQLLEQYDIRRGNVWVLVLVWVATGPAVVHRFRTRR